MSCLHSLLDDEDLLREILLRLPPQPSSLLRVSLVCKLWRRIVSDHLFLRRFRLHHRKPSLLGFFDQGLQPRRVPIFTPVLDCIPAARFALPLALTPKRSSCKDDRWFIMSCRYGLAVLVHLPRREIIIWDPLAKLHKCVPFPPGLQDSKGYPFWFWQAEVICVDAEDGHVHGDCFSSPFKLIFICGIRYKHACGCLYESASGVWGNIVPVVFPDGVDQSGSSVLVGNAIYWLFHKGDALAFDFERQSFALIEKPADAHITNYGSVQLIRTEDGGLGLAVLSELVIKLWERKSNHDGVVRWVVLQKTIQLDLFPCTIPGDCRMLLIVGYDEDSNVIVLSTTIGNFIVQVDSMQIRHVIKRDTICYRTLHPYTSFHTAVMPCEDDVGRGSKKSKLYSFARTWVRRTKKHMFTSLGS